MHAKCAKFAFQSLAFMRSLNFESKENNVEKVSMDQMRARSRQTKTPKHFMVNISNNHVRAAQFLSARLKVREFCRKQNNAITIHAMKYISHKFKYKVKTASCCCCCCYTIQFVCSLSIMNFSSFKRPLFSAIKLSSIWMKKLHLSSFRMLF